MPVKFTLFDYSEELIHHWQQSFQAFGPQELRDHISIIHSSFEDLQMAFDCIVSPASSFGIFFGGGFGRLLSDTLAPPDDPSALKRVVQTVLHERWYGYAPPGTCTLIPLLDTPCSPNMYNCCYIALCPTMRFPSPVAWNKEVVYNCVWSLLVEIDQHNARADENPELPAITSVGMTGLGTGVGRVAIEDCAHQLALAFAHYHEITSHPEEQSALFWEEIALTPLERAIVDDD